MKRQRDKNGRIQSTHNKSPEDILEEMEPGEHYPTRELADQVDIPPRTARNYLDKLADADQVEKEKINTTTALWSKRE